MPTIIGRLKRRAEFRRVAREGKKFAMEGLVLQVAPTVAEVRTRPGCDARLGLTVTRKIGGAVVRNRARRRLRAAAGEVLPACAPAGYDYVLIARRTTPTRPYRALIRDLEKALARLKRPRPPRLRGRRPC